MRVFSRQVCDQRVYFDNVRCERCCAELGYLPDRAQLHALRPVEGNRGWVPINGGISRYQRCRNWSGGLEPTRPTGGRTKVHVRSLDGRNGRQELP